MLTNLDINNLAIIEKLSIDFSSGFNVITGETGAGKSIMIKALRLPRALQLYKMCALFGTVMIVFSIGFFIFKAKFRAKNNFAPPWQEINIFDPVFARKKKARIEKSAVMGSESVTLTPLIKEGPDRGIRA